MLLLGGLGSLLGGLGSLLGRVWLVLGHLRLALSSSFAAVGHGLVLSSSFAAVGHGFALVELIRRFPFSAAQVLGWCGGILGRFWKGFGEVLGRFSGVRKPIKYIEKRIKTYKPYKKDFPFFGLRKYSWLAFHRF